MAGHEALVLLCRQELEHSPEEDLGIGSALSAQEQCSQYQDRQMHTCPDLLWPWAQLWSQMTQLRDLLLQEAYPIPFAFLLCPGKRQSHPRPHPAPPTLSQRLWQQVLSSRTCLLSYWAWKTDQSQIAAQLQTPTGFQCLTNEFIKQICLPDMEKVKVNDTQKIK